MWLERLRACASTRVPLILVLTLPTCGRIPELYWPLRHFPEKAARAGNRSISPPQSQITANTTYVASYFDPQGHYSADNNYFATAGVDNAPLHALANGVDGANGVYHYGTTIAFPTSTYQSSNYWVDVVFVSTDTATPPTVTSVAPASNSSGVGLSATATATFSEAMNASTINGTTFLLVNSSGTSIPNTVTYNATNTTATLTPTANLATSTTYTATVKGGASGVKDSNGNAMAADFSWSFTTGTDSTPPTVTSVKPSGRSYAGGSDYRA